MACRGPGVVSDTEDTWYEKLRAEYKPESVRLLLIGESAPSDHGGTRRRNFFYADHLGYDNLYRGVVEALYGLRGLRAKSHDKRPCLRRLQTDGVFLIDLVTYPVNDLKNRAARQAVLEENVPGCVERASGLDPEGIILCSSGVLAALAGPLTTHSLPILHSKPLPFPLGNVRKLFVSDFKEAQANVANS